MGLHGGERIPWIETNGSRRVFFFQLPLSLPIPSPLSLVLPPSIFFLHLATSRRQTSEKNELETWLPRFSLNWNCLRQWCNRVSNRAEIASTGRTEEQKNRTRRERIFFPLVLLASPRTTRSAVKSLAFRLREWPFLSFFSSFSTFLARLAFETRIKEEKTTRKRKRAGFCTTPIGRKPIFSWFAIICLMKRTAVKITWRIK